MNAEEPRHLPAEMPVTDVAATDAAPPATLDDRAMSVLALLRQAIDQIGQMAEMYRGDPIATGSALLHVDVLLADLRSVHADLRHWTGDAITTRTPRLVIEPFGVVQRVREGNGTQWDHQPLMRAVVQKAWDEGKIGAVQDVVDVLTPLLAPGYWRKGALAEFGIDPDDYSTTDRGRKSVKIVANSLKSRRAEST